MICSICEKEITKEDNGWCEGNNAQPINDGRCCNKCNLSVVLPARIRALAKKTEEKSNEK